MPVRKRPPAVVLAGLLTLLASCSGDQQSQRPWSIFVLQRHQPHDGLAVVSQPDGYGLHLYLETDTSNPGICQPRWIPILRGCSTAMERHLQFGTASRGNSSGHAEARCFEGGPPGTGEALLEPRPDATWQWVDSPCHRRDLPVALPAWEEQDLLTNPNDELKRQESLLEDADDKQDATSEPRIDQMMPGAESELFFGGGQANKLF